MSRRKRTARWYRRHPEQALREVASFDGRLQRSLLDVLAADEEAMQGADGLMTREDTDRIAVTLEVLAEQIAQEDAP